MHRHTEENPRPVFPDIHPNGTSKDGLLACLEDACAAILDAHDAIKKTAPNERDYYTRSEDAFSHAEDQHNWRLALIDAVLMDLEREMAEIDSQ